MDIRSSIRRVSHYRTIWEYTIFIHRWFAASASLHNDSPFNRSEAVPLSCQFQNLFGTRSLLVPSDSRRFTVSAINWLLPICLSLRFNASLSVSLITVIIESNSGKKQTTNTCSLAIEIYHPSHLFPRGRFGSPEHRVDNCEHYSLICNIKWMTVFGIEHTAIHLRSLFVHWNSPFDGRLHTEC